MKALPIISLICILFIPSCGSGDTLQEQIVGSWDMKQVFRNGEDVTEEHDPKNTRSITFNVDGTFMSAGFPVGTNTGKWSLDPETKELFIDSDAGEDDDSFWIVSIDDERMTWNGARDFAVGFTLTHARIEKSERLRYE